MNGWMGGWVDRMMIIITRDDTGVWNTVSAGMSWRTLLGSYTSTSAAEEQQQQPRRDNTYKQQATAVLVESCERIQLAVVL